MTASLKTINTRYEKIKNLHSIQPAMLDDCEQHYVDDVGHLMEEREYFLREMEDVLAKFKEGRPVWAIGMLETRINQERSKDPSRT